MICIRYEIINFSKQKGGMLPLQHLYQLAVPPPHCACSFPVGSAVSAVASPGQRDDRPEGEQTFLVIRQENTFPKYIVNRKQNPS